MQQIIGRKAEIEILQSALDSPKSEFIAVTGRRRIGKTFLINTFFENKICFYLTGVQNQPIKMQLKAFSSELARRKKAFTPTPSDWMEAFNMLRDYVEGIQTDQKKVIFIDELSWIDTQRSGFLQIFAHFWNSWAAWERNIILVVAGSSSSWIIKKIYNDTGGLHNRVTKRLWLEPFKLTDTEAFLQHKNIHLSRYDIALIYMALGGVPFYLNELQAGESATQAIDRLCFAPGGMMKTEFENLYASIFNKPEHHLQIVKTLAQHPYGMERNDLIKAANIPNSGNISKVLEELTTTGYIQYLIPFGKKSNGGKYVLADFYSRFYLNFVANNQNSWLHQMESQTYKTWCGLSFEWLCHYHKKEILYALGIGGVRTKTNYLTIKNEAGKMVAQIDMLIERADNAYNLCEIKFSNDVYTLDKNEAEAIRKKMFHLKSLIKPRQSVFPTMITTFGCEKNMHFLGVITHQVDLNALFIDQHNFRFSHHL